MKISRRVLATLTALILLFAAFPLGGIQGHAAKIVDSGKCGDRDSPSVSWQFDSDGVLRISGTGKIRNYDNPSEVPWHTYLDKGDIKSVHIEEGITSIGDYNFYCYYLNEDRIKELILPSSLLYIGTDNFDYANFKEIQFPGHLESIGNGSFSHCPNLSSVNLPESVRIIGSCFYGCGALENITFGSEIEDLGSNIAHATAFYNNPENWDNNVFYIGKYLISCDREMVPSKYAIKDGTLGIADDVFQSCEYLEEISIPKSLKFIGFSAFTACVNLKKVEVDLVEKPIKLNGYPFHLSNPEVYFHTPFYAFELNSSFNELSQLSSTVVDYHTFGEAKTVSQPDCENSGLTEKQCTFCGTVKQEKIPASGHSWNKGKVSTKATCETDGVKTYTCTVCKATKTEGIPATGHAFGEWKELNENEHQRICVNDPSHVETAAHTWNKGKVTTAATCETDGVKTYTCTVCKATRQETIPAKGHTFGEWKELNENEHQRICANDPSHVETAAHTWNKGKVTTAATCEADGVKTYTCTVCKATRQETIPATGHAFGDWTKLNDDEHQRVCANDPSHVETAAHTWNKGKVTTAATCEADGVKTYTCTVCKATKTETIPATGHAFGEWSKLDENEHQRICANDPSHIETAAHNWDEGKVTKEPAPGVEGERQFVCKDCDAVKTEPIDALPVETEAPTTEPPTTEGPTTEAPTTEPGEAVYYTLGDVNMDGKINSADARLALRAAAKVETLSQLQELLADVDENGKLKAADARTILRISARLEPKPEKQIPAA